MLRPVEIECQLKWKPVKMCVREKVFGVTIQENLHVTLQNNSQVKSNGQCNLPFSTLSKQNVQVLFCNLLISRKTKREKRSSMAVHL